MGRVSASSNVKWSLTPPNPGLCDLPGPPKHRRPCRTDGHSDQGPSRDPTASCGLCGGETQDSKPDQDRVGWAGGHLSLSLPCLLLPSRHFRSPLRANKAPSMFSCALRRIQRGSALGGPRARRHLGRTGPLTLALQGLQHHLPPHPQPWTPASPC